MPTRKYAPKKKLAYKKKKKFVKKSPYRKTKSNYTPNIGMPLVKRANLTYCQQFIATQTTPAVPASNRFLINSMYDPDSTGTGHQPMGYDQWSTFYKEYLVKGAKITATFTNVVPGNSPARVGITFMTVSSSLDADLTDRLERQSYKNTRLLLGAIDSKQTVTAYYSGKKAFDLKTLADEHQMRSVTTASPTLPAYLFVWVQEASGTGSLVEDILVEVKIEFICDFMLPIEIGPS